MATKRKAAGPGSDSKTALIVSLVCFVILSIGLGVLAYIEGDGQVAERKKAEDAEKKATANKKGEEWQEYQKLLFMVHSGHATAAERDKLESLRGRAASLAGDATEKQKTDELVEKWKKEVGSDPVAQKKTYLDQIEQLKNDLGNTQLALKETKDKLAEANKARDQAAEDLRTAMANFRTDMDKAKKDLQAAKDERSEEFKQQMALNATMQKQREELLKQTEAKDKETKDQVGKKEKELADKQILLDKLNARIVRPSPLEYDRPKGSIVRVDNRGNTVSVDIGSSDHVHEGLTFSITAKNAVGKSSKEPKGSIEVVGILGPHLSKARITEVNDKFRNPIVQGDLLYNPAWSPTMREHIAVAGLIDLTGDGRDSSAEFIKTLKKQNIEVDAYLDLKDLTIKGNGMDVQTGYLVLGDVPEFKEYEVYQEADRSTDRKKAIQEKITEMRLKANELGVEVIPARRFMNLIGYHLPRGATTIVPPNFDLRTGVSTPGNGTERKEPAKEGAKEAPKEAPKEPAKEEKGK